MPSIKPTTVAAIAAGLLFAMQSAAAHAEDYLSLSVGVFDGIRFKESAGQFNLEYRAEPDEYRLRPFLGCFTTTAGAFYGYGGVCLDLQMFHSNFYFVPNLAAGFYCDGNGRKMGGELQFRSGVEFDYQFANMDRLGIGINHISNAHIYPSNRGEETIFINYSVTLDRLFRRGAP